ncbi:MAG TPA: S8/S53 family peptidase, partial [Polyangiaceae bacterium LLY-WYZ-15_(1-7)]|nr:S8/S53 family peptidase [Polyangiaceae bacterium LLY-WYZ-15_(1-7)]
MKRTLLFPVLIVALACQGEGEPVGDARGELIASGFGGTGTGISSGSGGGSSSSSGSSASGVGSRTGVFTPAGGLSTRPGTSLPSTPAWRSCDRRRLIGHLRYADECPAPGGDWLADDRLAGLGTFCAYELPAGAPFSLRGLPEDRDRGEELSPVRAPTEWLEPDCPVVVPLSDDEVIASSAASHVARQRAQLDRVDRLPTASVRWWGYEMSYPLTQRVHILDVAPESQGDDGEPTYAEGAEHGFAVGLLMRDILCPEGRSGVCPVEFRTKRVLDLEYDDAPGARGYVGDLAAAIRDAVDEGARTIVLALGFHREFGETGGDEVWAYFEAGEVMLAALTYAACRDVVVVAAAGNTEKGSDYVGGSFDPMFPGGFETEGGRTCDNGRTPARRLVIAASALDHVDLPAPNARANGEAQLAAPGTAIVAPNPDRLGGAPDHLFAGTGSSWAAAHVAAAATLVRAYRPWLRPDQVRELLYESGVSLGREPGICGSRFGCAEDEMRRVDVCQALREVVEPLCQSASCSPLPRCAPVPAYEGEVPELLDRERLFAASRDSGVDAATFPWVRFEYCPGAVYASGTQRYCPQVDYENGIREPDVVSSQPGVDPCGACMIDATNPLKPVFVMSLDPALPSVSPVLRLGNVSYALGEALVPMAQRGPVRVALPPIAADERYG